MLHVTVDGGNAEEKSERSVDKKRLILNIVAIALCLIFIPILILNCTLIMQTVINKDEVPSIGKYVPLIVLTDSMYPNIKSGDLIICEKTVTEDIKIGDVISFFDPESSSGSVVTHRVNRIDTDEKTGKKSFRTQGDNNDLEDRISVPAEKVIGVWNDVRVAGLGRVVLFMQSTPGLIVCIFVPIAVLVGFELIRRKLSDKAKEEDIEALKAQIEELKAEKESGTDFLGSDAEK